jgi:hypothetical protein
MSLGAALLLANANAAKTPDLTKSCAKECPHAVSNDDALKCVENMEKSEGEAVFKKKHHSCYSAHEKYEKQTGKEEAGESAEENRNQ